MALKPPNWTGEERFSGVSRKPDACKLCPRYVLGNGFVPDEVKDTAKVLLVLPHPTKDDIFANTPVSGKLEEWWDVRVTKTLGVPRNVFGFSHMLRCQGFCDNKSITTQSARACVVHDAAIKAFNPNIFFVTFEIRDLLDTSAFYRLFLRTLERALDFRENIPGARPAVLCGEDVWQWVAPWAVGTGGVKSWNGHWFEGEWFR